MAGLMRLPAALLIVVLLGGCAATPADVGSSLGPLEDGAVSLHGVVVDPELQPVAGSTVSVQPAGLVATTTADGRFALGPLAPGDYVVNAERAGYAPATTAVSLTDATASLHLILTPVASDVPYHETRILVGYILCQVSNDMVGTNPCGPALVDFATGQPSGAETYILPFTIDAPGLADVLAEMDWTVTSYEHDMALQIWGPPIPGQAYPTQKVYALGTGGPPLRLWAHPGATNEGGKEVFYPAPNETETYSLVVAGWYANSTLPNVGVFLDHRFETLVTFFHNRPGAPDFSALPDQ